ncbi:MAG: recombinase family protein [Eubacterium sp.]|nr:recombinase family protein [Eubacterium sp.]
MVVPEEAAVVRDIFDMRLGGMKLADIARKLNGRDITCPAVRLISRDERKNYHGHTDGFVWTAASVGNILKKPSIFDLLQTHPLTPYISGRG